MKSSVPTIGAETVLREVVDEVIANLPAGVAEVRVLSPAGETAGAYAVEIIPSSKKSARITLQAEEGGRDIYIGCGDGGTRFEIAGDDLAQQLRDLLDGIIGGRFREEIVFQGDRMIATRGRVETRKGELESRSRLGLGAQFWRRTRRVVEYSPYDPASR